jgi:hypothetical protein
MNLILYIGMDVHNDSIAVSIAPSDSTEVRRWGVIGGTHAHVHRLIKQLQATPSRRHLEVLLRGRSAWLSTLPFHPQPGA